MRLALTDEEAAALINLLTGVIEADQYPMSRRIETVRQIRAKLPGVRIEPPAGRDFAAVLPPRPGVFSRWRDARCLRGDDVEVRDKVAEAGPAGKRAANTAP